MFFNFFELEFRKSISFYLLCGLLLAGKPKRISTLMYLIALLSTDNHVAYADVRAAIAYWRLLTELAAYSRAGPEILANELDMI